MSRISTTFKKNCTSIIIALSAGVLFWIVKAVIDSVLMQKGGLADMLLLTGTDEILLHLVVILFFLLVACFIQYNIMKNDLSERTALKTGEQYKNIIHAIPDIIYELDPNGKFVFLSDAIIQLGYEPEELIGKHFKEILHPECYDNVSRSVVLEKFRGKKTGDESAPKLFDGRRTGSRMTRDLEIRLIYKDKAGGTRDFYAEVYSAGMWKVYNDFSKLEHAPEDGNNPKKKEKFLGTIGIIRNITEHKKVKTALKDIEERYWALFERSLDGVYLHDLKGNFIDANESAMNIVGYTKEEANDFRFSGILSDTEIEKGRQVMKKLINTGKQEELTEYRLKRKDGSFVWVETMSSLIYKNGKPFAVQGIARDITERKDAEDKIKASLREKEVLLQEVHHRVKNNMQIISSLLSLQARYITNQEVRDKIMESRDRIYSMSLVHELLYNSEDMARVNFGEYVRSMSFNLYRTYNLSPDRIEMNIDADKSINLNINKAIPCGLIVNELMTNSFKHAFPDGKSGKIDISITRNDNHKIVLEVKDNGVGFHNDKDINEDTTFGMKIVKALIGQLEGSFEVKNSGGVCFRILFPDE